MALSETDRWPSVMTVSHPAGDCDHADLEWLVSAPRQGRFWARLDRFTCSWCDTRLACSDPKPLI